MNRKIGLLACTALSGAALFAWQQAPAEKPASSEKSAQRWRVQYFYDEAKSALLFHDVQAITPKRVMAVGSVVEGKGGKPVSVTTPDGGEHWQLFPVDENPISLFFLDDSQGWMVTEKGLWHTSEGGKDWRKLPKLPAQPVRVYFADAENGWAACLKKTVLVTHDGGRKWDPVPAAAEPAGAPERSLYNWITFANPNYGIITGLNQPVPRWLPMFPTALDPEDSLSRRETAHLSYKLTTNDGGKTWKTESASLIGRITKIRLSTNGLGLGLIEYADSFKYAAEVFQVEWKTGKNSTVFRDKKFAISDVWLTPGGTAFLAGVASPGAVRSVSPGKVKVIASTDLKSWTELPVDYRAVAQRVLLAGVGEDVWLITDNGMILKWM
jgi:photosystem II stability/assembly factor-like uncharacterized protein